MFELDRIHVLVGYNIWVPAYIHVYACCTHPGENWLFNHVQLQRGLHQPFFYYDAFFHPWICLFAHIHVKVGLKPWFSCIGNWISYAFTWSSFCAQNHGVFLLDLGDSEKKGKGDSQQGLDIGEDKDFLPWRCLVNFSSLLPFFWNLKAAVATALIKSKWIYMNLGVTRSCIVFLFKNLE